jgi:TrwC relaxase
MLSIGAVAIGSGGYYVAGVAEGLEDYYLPEGDREAPGEWFGRGVLGLGLSGEIERQAFLDLLANRDPNTGERPGSGREPGAPTTSPSALPRASR